MRRNILFLIFNIFTVLIFYSTLRELFSFVNKSELYSHLILIPFISGYFFYRQRRDTILNAQYSFKKGILVTILGIVIYLLVIKFGSGIKSNDFMSLRVYAVLLFWIGGFLSFYGFKSIRVSVFPVLFLFLLAPIPSILVEKFILFLQFLSSEVTYLLFKLTGVSFFREGYTFHLPGLSIEVAKQCSGIRSSLALIITTLIAGKIFLKSKFKRFILLLFTIPVTVFKNGLRIVALSLLGAYVDPRILGSELHRRGGIPFFGLALLLILPILLFLIKSEKKER